LVYNRDETCYSALVVFLDAEKALYKEWITGLVSVYNMAALLLQCRRNSKGFTVANGYYEFGRRPTQTRDSQVSLLGAVLLTYLLTYSMEQSPS
jgi:hypothetical protein